MSGEIVVPETPNWLNDLEAKREQRLKARLGHEAGAGAPCLKCEDKCPGLDLHFWRKACKICRCPKEEHDVPDDDIYGWAQFQLLGSKPNKIKTKIVLPGKNDEVELEWAPKGQKEIIDKYLKTLPPEALPVKGSQAAQDRKQLLQKQIPVHDIDPDLCHELNEEEVTKMEEYIAHVKKSSVGVGHIVNLSSVIKANLHNISPQEAHIIASRYAKGVPFSEIVKLQAGLAQNLENLTLNKTRNVKNQRPLIALHPNKLPGSITEENVQNTMPVSKFKDITHPWYTNSSPGKGPLNPQYAEHFRSKLIAGQQDFDHAIDEKLLQGTNFDPSKTPSQFLGYRTPGYRPGQFGGLPIHGKLNKEGLLKSAALEGGSENLRSTSPMPYQRATVEEPYGIKPSYADKVSGDLQNADQYGFENPYFSQKPPGSSSLLETRDPKALKSVKDLMYSTYDPSQGPIPKDKFENTRSVDERAAGFDPNTGFSTYKHGPGIIQHESLSLPDKNKQALVLGSEDTNNLGAREKKNKGYYGPGAVRNPQEEGLVNSAIQHDLPRFDPLSGKYITEDHRYPEQLQREALGQDNLHLGSGNSNNLIPNESKKGYYEPGSVRNPGDESVVISIPAGLPRFDPVTGVYIPEDHRYPQPRSNVLGDNVYSYGRNNPSQPELYRIDPKGANEYSESGNDVQKNPYDPYNPSIPAPHGNDVFDPTTRQFISAPDRSNVAENIQHFDNSDPSYLGRIHSSPVGRTKKPLTALHPGHINVPEDYLEPHMVNVGAIQDINPEVRAATTEINPGFDKDSIYSDNGAEYSPESIREILNNIKLPDCHHCKKPFDENEFAVSIDRANMLFHAQCFKCAGCNQNLADNIYFYHKETNNVYCGRDYAKIKGYPRCSACDELIFTKEYCLAENSTFHLKHFCCFQCDSPLAGQDYTLEDEKPYCLPCYETSKAAKCSTCGHVIKPDEVGCQINGVHFHAEDRCLRCIVCSVPLMGKKLLLRNEKLYCSHDCFNSAKK